MNDTVILNCAGGGLVAQGQGHSGDGKPAPCADRVRDRLAQKNDLTPDEISAELASVHGVTVHRASAGNLLHRLGPSPEKRCSPANSCGPTWPRGSEIGSKSANP